MIVGIDLGTSTSEVSILRDGKPELIREIGNSARGILPSVVGINAKGILSVGTDAVGLLAKPGSAVEEAKREMGKATRLRLGGEEFSPQEISAFILKHLKEEAERYLGEPVTDAVITVPAYFGDDERQATADAGELAGLRVRRLNNEPTAAALAYGLARPGAEEKIVVYDLGGGTLDVTVLEISEGYLDVFASTGNTRLGGKDFDERLMLFISEACHRETGVDVLAPRLASRVKAAARRAKEALSISQSTTVVLENLGLGAKEEPIDFEIEITRSVLERLIRPLVESTRQPLDEALAVKGLQTTDIGTVLLIGGSTRIPLVKSFVSEYFDGRELRFEVSPDEAVGLGAAILGGIVEGTIDPKTYVITDVMPFTLGVAVQRVIDDEKVSGLFDGLIQKQSTIPRTAKKTYSTSREWQDTVHVEVFQGDAALCRDNRPVANLVHEMKPTPEIQKVEIELSYDLNGTVVIVARDLGTGKETRKEARVGVGRMSAEEKKTAGARVVERWNRSSSRNTASPNTGKVGASPAIPAVPSPEMNWKEASLYPKVAALMTHAERRLDEFTPDVRDQVSRLLVEMRAALVAADSASLNQAETKLTDLLFDLG